MQDVSTIVVKTKYRNDFRRFVLQSLHYENLLEMINELYSEEDLCMTYLDDEGDQVMLTCETEFGEAVRLAFLNKPYILRISLAPSTSSEKKLKCKQKSSDCKKDQIEEPVLAQSQTPRTIIPTLDSIQEQIVKSIQEIQALTSRKTPVLKPDKLVPTCNEISRQIAAECHDLASGLPRYTASISEEITEQCKILSEQCSSIAEEIHQGSAAVVSSLSSETATSTKNISDEIIASVSDYEKKNKENRASEEKQLCQQATLCSELSQHIEERCNQLVETTRSQCSDISADIALLIRNL